MLGGVLIFRSLVVFLSAGLFCAVPALGSVSAIETTIDGDSRYWVNAFSLAAMEAEPVQDGGAQLFSYSYLSINTSSSYGRHWALRIPVLYNTAGFTAFDDELNEKQGIALGDIIVDYTISAALLPGEIEVFTRYRLEIPTSENSIDTRKIAGLRFDMIASRYLSKDFQLEYWPQFSWNIHTQTVYENEFGSLSHTKRYELEQRLSLWYRANPRLFLGVYVGTQDDWFNESNSNPTTSRNRFNRLSEHSFTGGPSVRYALNKNFTFLFSLQNVVPLWGFSPDRTGTVSDLGRFQPSQTEFVLLSFINF